MEWLAGQSCLACLQHMHACAHPSRLSPARNQMLSLCLVQVGVTFKRMGGNVGRVKCFHRAIHFRFLEVDARLSAESARDFPIVLALPDKELLRATSTSPEYEAARYAGDVRAALTYLLHAAAPASFVWEAGCRAWVECSKPPAPQEAVLSCPVAVALARMN